MEARLFEDHSKRRSRPTMVTTTLKPMLDDTISIFSNVFGLTHNNTPWFDNRSTNIIKMATPNTTTCPLVPSSCSSSSCLHQNDKYYCQKRILEFNQCGVRLLHVGCTEQAQTLFRAALYLHVQMNLQQQGKNRCVTPPILYEAQYHVQHQDEYILRVDEQDQRDERPRPLIPCRPFAVLSSTPQQQQQHQQQEGVSTTCQHGMAHIFNVALCHHLQDAHSTKAGIFYEIALVLFMAANGGVTHHPTDNDQEEEEEELMNAILYNLGIWCWDNQQEENAQLYFDTLQTLQRARQQQQHEPVLPPTNNVMATTTSTTDPSVVGMSSSSVLCWLAQEQQQDVSQQPATSSFSWWRVCVCVLFGVDWFFQPLQEDGMGNLYHHPNMFNLAHFRNSFAWTTTTTIIR